MGHKDHHEKSRAPVTVFVVTVSDTRTLETDESGTIIRDKLAAEGHIVSGSEIIPDEPREIRRVMDNTPAGTQAIIFNGGTGISRRDRTFDTLNSLMEKTLPGFGELFRMLSYEEIGAAAIMSRAIAGVAGSLLIFSIPGSKGAVTLAMDNIIIPELSHTVWEANR